MRRFLLAAVNPDRADEDVVELLERADVEAVPGPARRHRVAPLLHHRLSGLDAPAAGALAAQLRQDRLRTRALQLQAHATIAQLHHVLTVPFLIVKGAAVAQRWYADPSLRSYVDVDVLVRHSDFRAASELLTSADFTHLLPNWDGLLARGMAEVPLRHQSSTVDLHWHLIARREPRRAITLHEDAIFDRADTLTIGAVDVATLDRDDTLLHLCIHSGLDGGRRLHQLVDVDRVIRSGCIDWDAFTARARAANAHALCAAIIQRCHRLIGTPLPDGLLRRLQPFPGWTSVNARIDGLSRPDRRILGGIASGIVVAAGRATFIHTLAAGIRAVREAAHERLLHILRPRRPRGPGYRPSGDPQSLHRYLTWVDTQMSPARDDKF